MIQLAITYTIYFNRYIIITDKFNFFLLYKKGKKVFHPIKPPIGKIVLFQPC